MAMPLAHGGTPMLLYLSVDYPNLNPISSQAPPPPYRCANSAISANPVPHARTPLSPCLIIVHTSGHNKADTSLSSHIWWIWKGGPAYDVLMLEVVAKHPTWHKFHIHRTTPALRVGKSWWCLLATLGVLSDTYLLNLTMDRHVGREVSAAWPVHYVDYFSIIYVLEFASVALHAIVITRLALLNDLH